MIEVEYGKLYLVATPIGNLADITFRAIDTLKSVDLILAEDTRKTLKLLNHYEIAKPLISFYRHNEGLKADYVLKLLKEGKNLALVSDAGTPAISDPGEDLVRLAIQEGVVIISIPGPVACINGLIGSGFDTTRFAFEGFLSVNRKTRMERLRILAEERRTLLFYEAPHKLKRTLEDFLQVFGNRKIVLARELTKIYEEYIRCSIEEAIEKYKETPVKGEFVIILEGKKEEEKITEESIENLMEKYLEQGFEKKEAMKLVAQEKKMRKTEVYRYLLEKNKS